MQAGKSGIALALCCLQRLSLTDQQICNRAQLKDTLYLVTMPDTALKEQAEEDLKLAKTLLSVTLLTLLTLKKRLRMSSKATHLN